MSSQRARFAGSPAQVADALSFVTKAEFIIPVPRIETRVQKQNRIVKQRAVINALRGIQPNLAFTKSKLVSGLLKLAESSAWGGEGPEWKAWAAKTMLSLLRLLKSVAKAATQSPLPAWYKLVLEGGPIEMHMRPTENVPAGQPDVQDEMEVCSECSTAFLLAEYLYGYSIEHGAAWRQEVYDGKQVGHKEYTKQIKEPMQLESEDDGTVATWPDGHEAMNRAYPVKLFREKNKVGITVMKKPAASSSTSAATTPSTPSKSSTSASLSWPLPDGRLIKLCSSNDRNPIWWLKVGKSSGCQIRKDTWKDPNAAKEVMEDIASRFSKGQIKEENLYEERDAMIKMKGGRMPGKRASSQASGTTSTTPKKMTSTSKKRTSKPESKMEPNELEKFMMSGPPLF